MKRSLAALVLLVGACAPPPPASAPAAPAAQAAPLPAAVRWFRTSAEQRAAYLQTYRAAGAELDRLAEGVRVPWAVILDADETVLDNSLYEQQRAEQGLGYSPESWAAWVGQEAAPALPGAVDFTRRARALGGRVVIVTNRDEALCPATRRNLEKVGVAAAAVLCRSGASDKNPRFRAVETGTAGLPPLRVLLWVGDNIQDFPDLTQAGLRGGPAAAFAEFGHRYWVLPNPMYGSW